MFREFKRIVLFSLPLLFNVVEVVEIISEEFRSEFCYIFTWMYWPVRQMCVSEILGVTDSGYRLSYEGYSVVEIYRLSRR
jgi:hypothetical protein